jgi:hypothetical protein
MRLQESSEFVPDEAFVQRLWFEGLFQNPLTTTDGRKIQLHQPGFWNHSAGPDFTHAAAEIAGSGIASGPVEIHLTPDGFESHGHHTDPAYRDLLIHAVWTRGLSAPAPQKADGSSVPVVELSSQLRVPLSEAKACFASLPAELEVGARIGRCQQALSTLPESEMVRLIEEAGWFRFHQRVARWRLKAKATPPNELLWQGLAEVLGYARNREPMIYLSRALPVATLSLKPALEREALLFGTAGWMHQSAAAGLSQHVRSLWDFWWKHRDDITTVDGDAWNLSGIRPLNRPERRVAALAGLSDQTRFSLLTDALTQADTDSVKDLLLASSHPEWNHRFTLKGKRSQKRHRLIGAARIDAFLFNVFWPLAYGDHASKVESALRAARSSADSLASRRTKVRLFENTSIQALTGRLLATEGLLQIYRDFCLHDRSGCGQCEFPEWVTHWKQD